jgi:hypothetical protein
MADEQQQDVFLDTDEKRARALQLVIESFMDKKNRPASLQVEGAVRGLSREIDDVYEETVEYLRCVLRSYI